MRRLPLADRLRIGSPCDSDPGTSFCTSCGHEVHDIASLTRDEVRALLRARAARSKRLCIRVHTRKSDGAILLADGHAFPAEKLVARTLAATVATISAAALAGCASQGPPAAPTQYVDIDAVPKAETPPVVVEPSPSALGVASRATPAPMTPASDPLVGTSPLVPKAHATHPAKPKAVTTPKAHGKKTVVPPDDYTTTAGEILDSP